MCQLSWEEKYFTVYLWPVAAIRGEPPGSDFFFQTSHQEFSSLKQSNAESNQREEVLKKLASAHDSYVEISSNLREGTKVFTQHNTHQNVSLLRVVF